MNISEYAQKWDKDETNNFAAACYNDNSIDELACATIGNADKIDMKEWGITDPQEWVDAIKAALYEKTQD